MKYGNYIRWASFDTTCPICDENIPANEVHRHDGTLPPPVQSDSFFEAWTPLPARISSVVLDLGADPRDPGA